MNHFNSLHVEESNDPPGKWNIQPQASHLKSRISSPKTSPVVSAIMGILNHHAIDNGGVEVRPSYFPGESNSGSLSDPYTTSIKSIDGD